MDDTESNIPDLPKKVAFVSCEQQTFKINVGNGNQTVKWLALATATKIASSRKSKGRILSRSPNIDGRLNTLPVPQCVHVGRQRKWVHPETTINEVQKRFGGTCILYVDLEYRPKLEHGVHIRTIWSDLSFGGERGEERYQAWVAENRSKGITVGSLDVEEEKEHDEGKKESKESSIDDEKENLKSEFENEWRNVKLEKYGSELEKKRVSEYVFKYYVGLRDGFEDLSSQSLNVDRNTNGTITLPELIHFCWQNDLQQCMTGLRKTFQSDDDDNNKALKAQLDEENIIRQVATLVCFGEKDSAAVAARVASKDKIEEKKASTTNEKILNVSFAQFLEFLIRYAERKKMNGGTKNKSAGNYANAIACRQMLQRLEAPMNRRRNEKTRKLMKNKAISRVINDTSDAVRDVFENYCTADSDKNRKDQRWHSTMSLREFQLLMTDALLIGARPGDDGPQATSDSKKAFFGCQANDEGSAVAFLSMNVEERAANSNVLEDLVFNEFLEAIVRVALAKWDDPEIPALDKIQLANEAIAVLHQ